MVTKAHRGSVEESSLTGQVSVSRMRAASVRRPGSAGWPRGSQTHAPLRAARSTGWQGPAAGPQVLLTWEAAGYGDRVLTEASHGEVGCGPQLPSSLSRQTAPCGWARSVGFWVLMWA